MGDVTWVRGKVIDKLERDGKGGTSAVVKRLYLSDIAGAGAIVPGRSAGRAAAPAHRLHDRGARRALAEVGGINAHPRPGSPGVKGDENQRARLIADGRALFGSERVIGVAQKRRRNSLLLKGAAQVACPGEGDVFFRQRC